MGDTLSGVSPWAAPGAALGAALAGGPGPLRSERPAAPGIRWNDPQLHLAFMPALVIDPRMQIRSPLKLALLALAGGALVLTSGCGGKGGKNRDTAYVARDVDTLYQAAKDRLDRG